MDLTIHQLWMGDEVPPEIDKCIQTVKYNNPNAEHILWGVDRDLPVFIYQDIINQCKSKREASDIIRLELLYEYGGIWMDTDMICMKNLQPVYDISCGNFVINHESARQYTNIMNIGSYMFGCNKNEPWVKECLNQIQKLYEITQWDWKNIICPFQKAHDWVLSENNQTDKSGYGETIFPEWMFSIIFGNKYLRDKYRNMAYTYHFGWTGDGNWVEEETRNDLYKFCDDIIGEYDGIEK